MTRIVWRFARPILTFLATYFAIKDFTFSAASSVGKFAWESMFSSPYFVVLSTCVVFMFFYSYLPTKMLLNRWFSMAVIAMFFGVLFSSKNVVKHFKENVYTPQFLSVRSYLKNERTLNQLFRDNSVKSKSDMNRFAVSLLKAGSEEERKVFRHVINDGVGWFFNPFDKKQLTLNCVIYGDAETFNFLHKKGLIDLEASLKYERSALRSLTGKKLFTPLEIARMESNKEVEQRILALLTELNKRPILERFSDYLYKI